MRAYDVIMKKRDGGTLSKEELHFIVSGFVKKEIPDYQMAAFLMAVYFKGMTPQEQADFTMEMVNSGDKIDLSNIEGIKVDKHSTGGVGDTTTLVLAPIVAACGAPVAKMSGRGLGHTGGTLDKLETFTGFNIFLEKEDFVKNVNEKGIAVVGQTASIVPADKLMYAVRDVTATVDSVPLIAGSIMSKKLAAGADGVVLDVKTGNGAFMTTFEGSRELAQAMVDIGELNGRKMYAFITDMSQPLGVAVGNSLEVIEAIETLQGKGPKDLTELCVSIGSYMLTIAKIVDSPEQGRAKIEEVIKNGKALLKLKDLVKGQSGDETLVDHPERLPKAANIFELKADRDGYVTSIKTTQTGIAAGILGAGRTTKDDVIDLAVGFMIRKKLGDKITKGDTLVEIHYNDDKNLEKVKEMLIDAYTITEKNITPPPLVHAILGKDGIIKKF